MSQSEKSAASISNRANLSPDLIDTDITPGSALDLDGDGRRDSKEMGLYQLMQLQHGDIKAQHSPGEVLAVPAQLPSNKLPAYPPIKNLSCNDACMPPQFDNEQWD